MLKTGALITPRLTDSHNVSQNPVTTDLLDVSLDMSAEDRQRSEGQGENERTSQTAADVLPLSSFAHLVLFAY